MPIAPETVQMVPLQFACFLQDRRAVGEQMFLRSCRRLGHIQRFQRWNSCPWIRYINSMWMCPRCRVEQMPT